MVNRVLLTWVAAIVGWWAFGLVTWLYDRLFPARSGQWNQIFGVPVEGLVYAAIAWLLVTTAVILGVQLVASRRSG